MLCTGSALWRKRASRSADGHHLWFLRGERSGRRVRAALACGCCHDDPGGPGGQPRPAVQVGHWAERAWRRQQVRLLSEARCPSLSLEEPEILRTDLGHKFPTRVDGAQTSPETVLCCGSYFTLRIFILVFPVVWERTRGSNLGSDYRGSLFLWLIDLEMRAWKVAVSVSWFGLVL